MSIDIAFEWFDEPKFVVELETGGVRVRAHPGLSEAQVREACSALDGRGPAVFAAWQQAVGLDASGTATSAR